MTASVAQARACDDDAGAPPTNDMNWDQLDWAEITEEVLADRRRGDGGRQRPELMEVRVHENQSGSER